jgi:hypothetical protein
MVDEGKLHQFIGQMLSDLGGAAAISMVRIGDALGLYRTLHAKGSMTTDELANETGVNQRYLREWLSHQAASNYLTYEPASGRFTLPAEQAMVFAIEDSPVTFFDCLHDMGDPAGAAAHVRQSLKPDGTWMIVEPMAGDRLEDNLNPVGRLYYAGSTMVCVPTSLSQEVGAALGAQAGEAKLREVVAAGGFRSIRRATETPFNMILEARV